MTKKKPLDWFIHEFPSFSRNAPNAYKKTSVELIYFYYDKRALTFCTFEFLTAILKIILKESCHTTHFFTAF